MQVCTSNPHYVSLEKENLLKILDNNKSFQLYVL